MQNSFKLKLKDAYMITPTVRHLEFEREDKSRLRFVPGQFLTFHFTLENQLFSRSYSIATIANEKDTLEIAVSPFQGGPGTRKLFSLQPGDEIDATGPFGRLVLKDEPVKRYILVATGTGVTPYRAMLPALIERIHQQKIEVVILQGVKSKEELLYGDDFIKYAQSTPQLHFHAFYSRTVPENPFAYEHRGYVQTSFSWLNLDPDQDIFYLCGNPNMIDEAFAYLKEFGFDTAKIRREKYISPKK